jgi:SNF2 family DNA or RNA helicase
MQKVELQGLEKMVYERVSAFVREYYYALSHRNPCFNQLTLMLFQKLLTSSPRALSESMKNVLEKGQLDPWFENFFTETVSLCEQIEVPAKFSLTADLINSQLNSEHVLIFTQFLATQRHLYDFLQKKTGRKIFIFHGEMNIHKKDEIIQKFRDNSSSILISTDSGAEGRNLQFARYLINFDFPWNPMKVEQRIGRIHRLGQERETLIMNLCSAGTIEEHIVDLLLRKIRLFERVVGELEMILGYLATEYTDIEVMDKKIMDIIVKYQSFSEQKEQVEKIAGQFTKAAETFEETLKRQEYIFGN